MALLSAYEDFLQRSVALLSSTWEKLEFVASLRREDGYRHFGMEQRFGTAAAASAIAEVHSLLHEELAATNLQQLWETASEESRNSPKTWKTLLRGLNHPRALPPDVHGVPVEHLEFVFSSLHQIAEHHSAATRSVA
jgi:hypothetical protein